MTIIEMFRFGASFFILLEREGPRFDFVGPSRLKICVTIIFFEVGSGESKIDAIRAGNDFGGGTT